MTEVVRDDSEGRHVENTDRYTISQSLRKEYLE